MDDTLKFYWNSQKPFDPSVRNKLRGNHPGKRIRFYDADGSEITFLRISVDESLLRRIRKEFPNGFVMSAEWDGLRVEGVRLFPEDPLVESLVTSVVWKDTENGLRITPLTDLA